MPSPEGKFIPDEYISGKIKNLDSEARSLSRGKELGQESIATVEGRGSHIEVTRELTPEMVVEIKTFHKRFEEGEPDTRTPEQRKEDKDKHSAKSYSHLFCVDTDGSIVGTLDLYDREVDIEGDKVRIGGIGEVATLKEKRGQGIASRLLAQAMEEFKKDGYDIAMLNTNIDDPRLVRLYERAGFQVLTKPYTFKGKSGKEYTETNGMIAPVNSKEKLRKIVEGRESLDIGQGNW